MAYVYHMQRAYCKGRGFLFLAKKMEDHKVNRNFRILNWRYLPYIRPISLGLCKWISPQNMARNMVQYLHVGILEWPLTKTEDRRDAAGRSSKTVLSRCHWWFDLVSLDWPQWCHAAQRGSPKNKERVTYPTKNGWLVVGKYSNMIFHVFSPHARWGSLC